jgi:excisionase family DNA binding protein
MTTRTDNGDLLTIREVSRQFRVDATTVRRWIMSGSLEAITLPHAGKRQVYRIKADTIAAIMSGEAKEQQR